jgi:PPOX class probable F420-dependent enzyme
MTAQHDTAAPYPTLSPTARRFLDAPRYAVVATVNSDGSALQAAIWYRLEGDSIVFNSRIGRLWPKNLQRDGRVSVIVVDAEEYVEMRGLVEIDEDPELGQRVIAELAQRYQPDVRLVEAQIAGFATQRRVTFRLRPSRVFERFSGD